jgi:hypothetical protein
MITKHEKPPWQPDMEREPEFNPYVNPMDRTGQLENPPPLDNWEPNEDESAAQSDERVAVKPSPAGASANR